MSTDPRFSAFLYINNISKQYDYIDKYFTDFPQSFDFMNSLYDKTDISNVDIPITPLEMLNSTERDDL